jgi:hypothetical protein
MVRQAVMEVIVGTRCGRGIWGSGSHWAGPSEMMLHLEMKKRASTADPASLMEGDDALMAVWRARG